jgi:hypothetical protein
MFSPELAARAMEREGGRESGRSAAARAGGAAARSAAPPAPIAVGAAAAPLAARTAAAAAAHFALALRRQPLRRALRAGRAAMLPAACASAPSAAAAGLVLPVRRRAPDADELDNNVLAGMRWDFTAAGVSGIRQSWLFVTLARAALGCRGQHVRTLQERVGSGYWARVVAMLRQVWSARGWLSVAGLRCDAAGHYYINEGDQIILYTPILPRLSTLLVWAAQARNNAQRAGALVWPDALPEFPPHDTLSGPVLADVVQFMPLPHAPPAAIRRRRAAGDS